MIDQLEDIARLFTIKFSKIFSAQASRIRMNKVARRPPGSVLQWEENLNMMPNEEEVCKALSSMGSDKAPGPDGLPVAFFKAHWDTIRPDILKMIS